MHLIYHYNDSQVSSAPAGIYYGVKIKRIMVETISVSTYGLFSTNDGSSSRRT